MFHEQQGYKEENDNGNCRLERHLEKITGLKAKKKYYVRIRTYKTMQNYSNAEKSFQPIIFLNNEDGGQSVSIGGVSEESIWYQLDGGEWQSYTGKVYVIFNRR